MKEGHNVNQRQRHPTPTIRQVDLDKKKTPASCGVYNIKTKEKKKKNPQQCVPTMIRRDV